MTPQEYYQHPTLCSLPWTGLFINPDGKIKNCAISKAILGNLHQQPLEQILHGPINQQIKTDMLNKVKHPRCSTCYNVENISANSQNISNRTWYKKIGIKDVDLSLYDQPENFDLKVLDLRWRNTCNLACVYCGPNLSSRWAKELNDKSRTIEDHVMQSNKKYIFDQLESITHVYLAGGEPLLIKENLELLQLLLIKNPQVDIRINTNLINIDNDIFRTLTKFKNVKWTISVDAIEQAFDYIRWPADWNVFRQNLKLLQQQHFDINFNMVWFLLNHDKIFDCIDLLTSDNFHENTFIIQCLDDPVAMDVRNLPDHKVQKLQEKIQKLLKQTNSSYWLHRSLVSMYNFLDTPMPDKNFQASLDFFNNLDLTRNLDHKKIFTGLYKD